jgi:UDP-glucuronate 4-epimerase
MKRIIITGGAGFIGSHLVDSLLAEQAEENDARIIVVDDFNDFYSPAIKYQNIDPHMTNPRFTLIKSDIGDSAQLEKVFAKFEPDCVVHLAARAGVRPSLNEPALYAETNINGTLAVLELSRQFGVESFIFASSSSVYGINEKMPFSEDDFIARPVSPYAMTKAAGEMLCHTYSHLYKLRCVCLRFFTVYGARQRPDLAIHKFARLISGGCPLPVYGNGDSRRDYTFIGDIIQGMRAAIDYRASFFEIFNLGESQTIELRRLIELLKTEMGMKAVIDRKPEQPGDVPQTFADIGKARRLLGYEPKIKIEEGIKNFVQWFMSSKMSNLSDIECFKQIKQMSTA